MLLHAAQHHWPAATSTSLWPYVVRKVCQFFNAPPTLQGSHKVKTPHELFTGMGISAEIQEHQIPIVYVLANPLQQGNVQLYFASTAATVSTSASATFASTASSVGDDSIAKSSLLVPEKTKTRTVMD
jgi:hypothetical protein